MKTLSGLIWYVIILALGTYVIGFVLNVVSIWIPPVASYVFCPEDTRMTYSWDQASWDHPGQKTLGGTCVDKNGQSHNKLPDDVVTPREFRIFMPISFVIMLVILIARFFSKRRQAQKKAVSRGKD